MELIFLLFIISGWLKAYFSLFNISIPFDITLVFALLLVLNLICKRHLKITNNATAAFFFLLLFYFWMLATLLYTPSLNYSKQKALYFILNIIAFLYPVVSKNFCVRKFFRSLIICTFLLGIINIGVILAYHTKLISYETYIPWKGQYLRTGMYLGLSVVTIFCSRFRLFESKNMSISLFILSFILMIMSAARGPVIFALVICFVYWLCVTPKSTKISKYINTKRFTIIGSAIIFVLVFSGTIFTNFINRFGVLIYSIFSEESNQTNMRLIFLKSALNSIMESIDNLLFGNGIASYGIIVYNIDGRYYPHNIIIEILFEYGLVGLTLFTMFLIISLNKIEKTNLFLFTFLYIFANALKSYSLIDLRILFALTAFTLMYKKFTLLKVQT